MKKTRIRTETILLTIALVLALNSTGNASNCNESWKTVTPADIEARLLKNADPNTSYEDGSTPLHCAAALNENPEVSQILLNSAPIPTHETKLAGPLYIAQH